VSKHDAMGGVGGTRGVEVKPGAMLTSVLDSGEWAKSPPGKDAAYPPNVLLHEPKSRSEYGLNKMKVSN
jgi:hypothetical protein